MSGASSPQLAAVERTPRLTAAHTSAAKSALAESILDAEDALTSVHRSWFAPATRPCAPSPERVDESTIRTRHAEAAVRGVPWFDLPNRRRAARVAQRRALTDIGVARRAAEERVQAEEQRIDQWWAALCANDPRVVTEHVNGVFASDRGTRAAALGTHGACVEVAVVVSGEHVLPAEEVRLAADGSLTIRRASVAHRAQLYRQHVAAVVIATARRALAASPGADSVKVHALRATCTGPFDDLNLLAVAELTRDDILHADFGMDAVSLLLRFGRGVRIGAAGIDTPVMVPLALDTVPGLAERLEEVCAGHHRASA
ncbi:hypothetical protein G7075_04710 [Phycicoccus sp. HDW14]|uniref:hypothetical protein n=1 Tax=Phycicoccus sp. HDW14 TaxID=2714941 RepID=UPI00140E41A7|nr:hypothetical protein [Phycicoccus sp. HDW14]QIM20613.1 hypothetical protein G7075_04710 [Phycicoccus sp. HDW14]